MLAFATPIFGFALTPPSPAEIHTFDTAAAISAARSSDNNQNTSKVVPHAALHEELDAAFGGEEYTRQLKQRVRIAKIHRALGIATWGMVTVAGITGLIQYYNLYGVFAGQGSNPCVKGNAVFGQSQCYGTPWPHLITASIATALYAATFTMSFFMPDPDRSDVGNSPFAKRLRLHKLLRWVHLGGMIAQTLLGAILANNTAFGMDRANDYRLLQALATVHLGIGLVTYGALTWAGALMVL